MKTFNSSEILDRLRGALKLSNDTELATTLGIKKATLSNWRSRNSLDWPLLFSFCKQMDLNWLVWGDKTDALQSQTAPHETPSNDALITHLDSKLREKDKEIGNLREEIGRLKAHIEALERGETRQPVPVYVHSQEQEAVET